jgi:hypothetical protein
MKKITYTNDGPYTLKWEQSPIKYKKYRVTISKKDNIINTVDFGDTRYEHYKDSTPLKLYSNLDHNDPIRRKNYRARHSKIKLKDGRLAYKVKYTPSYLSYNFLW